MKILAAVVVICAVTFMAGCAARQPALPEGASAVSAGPPERSPYQCFTDNGFGGYRRCDEID